MFKRISKLSCLMLMLLAGAFPTFAHNAVKMIHPDNKETIFLLSSQPKVSIENSSLVVESDENKVTCELNGSVRFEFLDAKESAIDEVATESLVFKVDNQAVEGGNMTPNSPVAIYDLSGKTLKAAQTDEAGYIRIDIYDLPKGVYIFNSIDKNFKFYKK